MPDTKISALAAATTLHAADLFVVVDTTDTSMAASGTDKKLTFSQLQGLVGGGGGLGDPNITADGSGNLTLVSTKFTGSAPSYAPASVACTVVGGGGPGGSGVVGGGGSGGQVVSQSYSLTGPAVSVQIGAGGIAAVSNALNTLYGAAGASSIFGSVTALGGVAGGSGGNQTTGTFNGQNGPNGSGGGGYNGTSASTGGSSTATGGHAGGGGTTSGPDYGAGGGGGAGGAGGTGSPTADGIGGIGAVDANTGNTYAAGGNGGAAGDPRDGTSAAANSGNGGSGCGNTDTTGVLTGTGGNGGSGVVTLKFATAAVISWSYTGISSSSTSGSNTIVTLMSWGTFSYVLPSTGTTTTTSQLYSSDGSTLSWKDFGGTAHTIITASGDITGVRSVQGQSAEIEVKTILTQFGQWYLGTHKYNPPSSTNIYGLAGVGGGTASPPNSGWDGTGIAFTNSIQNGAYAGEPTIGLIGGIAYNADAIYFGAVDQNNINLWMDLWLSSTYTTYNTLDDGQGNLIIGKNASLANNEVIRLASGTGRVTCKSIVLAPQSSPPASPTEGQMYVDNAHVLHVYLNGVWKAVTVS